MRNVKKDYPASVIRNSGKPLDFQSKRSVTDEGTRRHNPHTLGDGLDS